MPTIATGTSANITVLRGYRMNLDGGASGTLIVPSLGPLYATLGNYQSIGPFAGDTVVQISVDAGRGAQNYSLTEADGLVPGYVPNAAGSTVSTVLGQSAIAQSVTGTVTETTLASLNIPGGMMGPSGVLRITALFTVTNSANNKTLQVKLGGTSFFAPVLTTSASAQAVVFIRNRGVQNSQIAAAPTGTTFGIGASTVANVTGAVNTALTQPLIITGTLANTGETITLEGFAVEVLPG